MHTKLTLSLEPALINQAKKEARRRGSSLSGMVADYFRGMVAQPGSDKTLPPLTRSLFGSLKRKKVDRDDYRRHLEAKYR